MSAPDTNTEKQTRRHRPVLVGIAVVALFAAIVFMFNVGSTVDEDVEPTPQVLEEQSN